MEESSETGMCTPMVHVLAKVAHTCSATSSFLFLGGPGKPN